MVTFGPDTPVLLTDHTEYGGRQCWLLYPAWQYRVVSPVVQAQRMNAFQRAILGLARAGERDVARLAELLGLEPELAEVVLADLRQLSYLDEYGAVTPVGAAALADGFLDPTRTIVTYVFQDPFNGKLFPASISQLRYAPVRWERPGRAVLQFGTAGVPQPRAAVPVRTSGTESVDPPGPEDIVEAVARGESERQRRRRQARWAAAPPERIVTRVSVVTDGQPVYLPVALLRKTADADGGKVVSWLAFSPFAGKSSTFLRRMVAARAQKDERLQETLDRFLGRATQALYADYDLADIRLTRRVIEELEARFGPRLRDHEEMVELLTLVEIGKGRLHTDGLKKTELGSIVRDAWQIHEMILRELLGARPAQLPRTGRDAARPLWQRIGQACQRLGMRFTQHSEVSFVSADRVQKAMHEPDRAKTPELLTALVFAADSGGADHPFRRLAAHRPYLLTDLMNLSGDRNVRSHGKPVEINREFAELAWRLAQEVVAVYLDLPIPDLKQHP